LAYGREAAIERAGVEPLVARVKTAPINAGLSIGDISVDRLHRKEQVDNGVC
jgi:hypothetical protein